MSILMLRSGEVGRKSTAPGIAYSIPLGSKKDAYCKKLSRRVRSQLEHDFTKILRLGLQGTSVSTMMNTPEDIPFAPMPMMARPRLGTCELGAVAATMEPTSNIATRAKRTGG